MDREIFDIENHLLRRNLRCVLHPVQRERTIRTLSRNHHLHRPRMQHLDLEQLKCEHACRPQGKDRTRLQMLLRLLARHPQKLSQLRPQQAEVKAWTWGLRLRQATSLAGPRLIWVMRCGCCTVPIRKWYDVNYDGSMFGSGTHQQLDSESC